MISLAPALVDIEKIFSLDRLIEFIVDHYEFFAYPLSLYLIHLGLSPTTSSGMYTSLRGTTVIAGAFVGDLEIHFSISPRFH